MRTVPLKHREGTTAIVCGAPFAELTARLDPHRTIIVTDPTVHRLHGARFGSLPVALVGEGEAIKTLETVETLYRTFRERAVDRSWTVVAVGGGIVCDIAGMAAATWMRGVRGILVPTTLLAMVDAAIGGKNGVNYRGYKNMIGTIRQPEEVLIDPSFLATLPPREMNCGRAEMLKHGLIADARYLEELEKTGLTGTPSEELIARSVEIKVSIVAQDETETDSRRILNFGHTVGHALEKLDPTIPHGEAIAVGMAVAAEISRRRGFIAEEAVSRIRKLLVESGLPVTSDQWAGDIASAIGADKKRHGETVAMVLLKRVGEAVVVDMPLEELAVTLAAACR